VLRTTSATPLTLNLSTSSDCDNSSKTRGHSTAAAGSYFSHTAWAVSMPHTFCPGSRPRGKSITLRRWSPSIRLGQVGFTQRLPCQLEKAAYFCRVTRMHSAALCCARTRCLCVKSPPVHYMHCLETGKRHSLSFIHSKLHCSTVLGHSGLEVLGDPICLSVCLLAYINTDKQTNVRFDTLLSLRCHFCLS